MKRNINNFLKNLFIIEKWQSFSCCHLKTKENDSQIFFKNCSFLCIINFLLHCGEIKRKKINFFLLLGAKVASLMSRFAIVSREERESERDFTVLEFTWPRACFHSRFCLREVSPCNADVTGFNFAHLILPGLSGCCHQETLPEGRSW